MKPLTARQQEILDYLVSFQNENGRSPSGPEIARQFGFTQPKTAYRHLAELEQKGYLTVVQPGHRQPLYIKLTREAEHLRTRRWPVLGAIPAGRLTEHPTDVIRWVEGVEDLIPGLRAEDFFLTVQGDSMTGAGIEPGQLVVIRPNREPRRGDICAVWVESGGGTLKRVYPQGKRVKLVAENPRYEPQVHKAEEVRIQGVLVATVNIHVQTFE